MTHVNCRAAKEYLDNLRAAADEEADDEEGGAAGAGIDALAERLRQDAMEVRDHNWQLLAQLRRTPPWPNTLLGAIHVRCMHMHCSECCSIRALSCCHAADCQGAQPHLCGPLERSVPTPAS